MEKSERLTYEYQVDADSDTAAARVVRFVGREKRVLEIGAGPGSITSVLKARNNCRVTAIELDPRSIEKLKSFCDEVYRQDLNDPGWTQVVSIGGKFDVIVAADVLEHLYDPWATLASTKSILADDGYVVVSLPHIGHNAVVACLLNEDFGYQEWGLLDKTHIRFFGLKNIGDLFRRAGMKIVGAQFVIRNPEQTEFAHYWRGLPSSVRDALSLNRHGSVYQVVLKAVPDSSPLCEIELIALEVPQAGSGFSCGATWRTRVVSRLKNFARARLSFEMRAKIARWLARIGLKV